ncbi:hypothetical protein J6590_035872 [Homalodisca vitripennis]|nr:hypothetical protein J6590_035872 [Homalodisca vitripennis]
MTYTVSITENAIQISAEGLYFTQHISPAKIRGDYVAVGKTECKLLVSESLSSIQPLSGSSLPSGDSGHWQVLIYGMFCSRSTLLLAALFLRELVTTSKS